MIGNILGRHIDVLKSMIKSETYQKVLSFYNFTVKSLHISLRYIPDNPKTGSGASKTADEVAHKASHIHKRE